MVEACHNMACWHHGAADEYLWLHMQTHHLMKYYVHHKFGMSDDYNTYTQHPWHGAGQGAADAALRYIVLSNTPYHSKIQPHVIKDPMLTLQIMESIKAFIDDVKMSTQSAMDNLPDLIQQAQTQLQWWNQLIVATGGPLNPQKCCCTVYTWQPDKLGILCLSQLDSQDISISVNYPHQLQEGIQVLKPSEGTRYLGIYLATSSTTKTMETQLWKKAVLNTKAFQQMHMSRRKAGVLY